MNGEGGGGRRHEMHFRFQTDKVCGLMALPTYGGNNNISSSTLVRVAEERNELDLNGASQILFHLLIKRSASCEIRNPRSHEEGGKLTWQNIPKFFIFYYDTLCLYAASRCFRFGLYFWEFFSLEKRKSFQFNFRFHLSKVSDACAKKLNYTVCKWHNREFYFTCHM